MLQTTGGDPGLPGGGGDDGAGPATDEGNCGVNPIPNRPGFSQTPRGVTGNERDPRGGYGDFSGSRRNSKTRKRYLHGALDIAGILNTSPVYAYRSGTVIAAGYGDRSGYYVTIDHGDGIVSTYMHLMKGSIESAFGVNAAREAIGRQVTTGTQIGILGNTGNAGGTPPHLHFQLKQNGVPIDPAGHLNNPCPPNPGRPV